MVGEKGPMCYTRSSSDHTIIPLLCGYGSIGLHLSKYSTFQITDNVPSILFGATDHTDVRLNCVLSMKHYVSQMTTSFSLRDSLQGYGVSPFLFDEVVIFPDGSSDEEINQRLIELRQRVLDENPNVPDIHHLPLRETSAMQFVRDIKHDMDQQQLTRQYRPILKINVETMDEYEHYEAKYSHLLTILRERYGADFVDSYIYIFSPDFSDYECLILMYRRQNRMDVQGNSIYICSDGVDRFVEEYPDPRGVHALVL